MKYLRITHPEPRTRATYTVRMDDLRQMSSPPVAWQIGHNHRMFNLPQQRNDCIPTPRAMPSTVNE